MAQLVMTQHEAKSHMNIDQQSQIFQVIQGIAKAGLALDGVVHVLIRRAQKPSFTESSKPAAEQGLQRTQKAYLAVLGSCDLRQIDRRRQDGLVMDVEVPLQLCLDGCTESLKTCIRCLCSHPT